MSPSIPVRSVVCPTCKRPSPYSSVNPYRPFCCERCRDVDFGAWATESFRVEADRTEAAQGSDLPQTLPPPH